ncbi:TPA: SGNH/GDSL hydrolase family protein [Pasteurella multocida]|uniref:SGNH/GDSL hydrolase family protein n=1 Tax=Pasteurella multocida TaxID=747 RepID=UPI0020257CF6|nr:SGNH/GDSL hydrolase family protein [Pasteurella multocida]URJ97048.1 SGNH/GDSL hydrolase family protein [Pasteurella multocida]HEA3312203.1 acylneuraminate cytidylyltransferase [Pasteurella multocida]HED4460950.1 acylneuraminate cytidylyltransferase [Pasteurella multocida]
MLSDQDIYQRYQSKMAEFSKPTNISLIGHSLFDMWDEQVAGTPQLAGQTVANLGLSGVSTRQYLDVIVKPKRIQQVGQSVFLFLGVNDICKEETYSPAQVMRWLNDILTHLHTISPMSHYFLLEATPVNQINTVTNAQIHTLNTYLKQHCPSDVTYVETQKYFCDPKGELDLRLCTDGLHFNEQGYQVLKAILEQCIANQQTQK